VIDRTCKSPIRWYGAKARLAKTILSLLPTHERFVDAFGGSASMLLQKPPCAAEVLNDLQADLMSFWRVVQNPALVLQLIAALRVTSIEREEWESCDRLYDACTDRIERARMFFVLTKLSFNGCFRAGWSNTTAPQYRTAFPNAVERLAQAHTRLQGVTLENLDFRALIAKYDDPATCIYLDPPYIADTRKTKKRYMHEMSDFDHEELVRCALASRCSVVLSGYAHPIYDNALKNWDRVEIPTVKHSAQGKSSTKPKAVEVLWIKRQGILSMPIGPIQVANSTLDPWQIGSIAA
jgi:DNA adenine methylase